MRRRHVTHANEACHTLHSRPVLTCNSRTCGLQVHNFTHPHTHFHTTPPLPPPPPRRCRDMPRTCTARGEQEYQKARASKHECRRVRKILKKKKWQAHKEAPAPTQTKTHTNAFTPKHKDARTQKIFTCAWVSCTNIQNTIPSPTRSFLRALSLALSHLVQRMGRHLMGYHVWISI